MIRAASNHPAEVEIKHEFGVSANTLRAALAKLCLLQIWWAAKFSRRMRIPTLHLSSVYQLVCHGSFVGLDRYLIYIYIYIITETSSSNDKRTGGKPVHPSGLQVSEEHLPLSKKAHLSNLIADRPN